MPKKMKIGVLVSHSGPAGLWGPSTDAAAFLAASELNAGDGVLGHEVDLVVADPGWEERDAARVVRDMIELDGIHALVGMHPSNIRSAVKVQLGGRIPYIYTPQYEGGECNATTIATGGTDGALMRATFPWLVERYKAKRFCLLANNYVWPEQALNTAKSIIGQARGRIVGEALVPFGSEYTAEIELIRQARPDIVLTFLLGEELVRFSRAFGAAGLSSSIVRYALGLDENVLYGIGVEGTENLFGASTFAANHASSKTMQLLERYYTMLGSDAPTMTVFGQSCYEGIHLAADLARHAGSVDPEVTSRYLRARKRQQDVRGILGPERFNQENSIYLLQAKDLALEPVHF
ncbi:MAG: substrate-binding domain-containing protein [Rhizobium sp.]|nr:substrate-binding domain-containing protein [Rhizobium sp.]